MIRFLLLIFMVVSTSAFSQTNATAYSLGTLPTGITLPAWPADPITTTTANVSTNAEFEIQDAIGGVAITITADISGTIDIDGDDIDIDLNGFTIGGLNVSGGSSRSRIKNGIVSGSLNIGGDDVFLDNINALCGNIGRNIAGNNRAAIINSSLCNDLFALYLGPTHSQVIVANTDITSSQPVRVEAADRVIFVDNFFDSTGGAQAFRIGSGDPSKTTRGAHDFWVARNIISNGTMIIGTVPSNNTEVSDVLIEDNSSYGSRFTVNNLNAPVTLITNTRIYRNTVYRNGSGFITGAGGDTANGYEAPSSGVNQNILLPFENPPAWTGGYGSSESESITNSSILLNGFFMELGQ